jgi:hydroxymethylglutaryl-CoA synthase
MIWRDCGIRGFGTYVPRYRVAQSLLSPRSAGATSDSIAATKAVPFSDEDACTMAIEAGRAAISDAGCTPMDVDAVWIGSESRAYAVKSTASTVANVLGMTPWISSADVEYACRAGVEVLLRLASSVESEHLRCPMVIASDRGLGMPGDVLDQTASSAATAFILGPVGVCRFIISESVSYISDTPDFFRRDCSVYPSHGGRFTGRPGYFHHVAQAATRFMDVTGTTPASYRYAVFHQPTSQFLDRIASQLGFTEGQVAPGRFVDVLGNPYAANAPLGLAMTLAKCEKGDTIFVACYGSGAGADCFAVRCLCEPPPDAPSLALSHRRDVKISDYAEYLWMTQSANSGE